MADEKQALLPIYTAAENTSHKKPRQQASLELRSKTRRMLTRGIHLAVAGLMLIGLIYCCAFSQLASGLRGCHGGRVTTQHEVFSDRTHLALHYLETTDSDDDKKHLVTAKHGAVACDVPACSTLGTEILKRGGSAVDASITTALCIGSINSFSSGLGGGGFMVVKPAGDENATAFNFREKAGRYAHKDMYKSSPLLSKFGGLAVAVPGELAGLYEAYTRFSSGRLSWAELIEPVARLNREGFAVEEPLARAAGVLAAVSDNEHREVREAFDWLFDDRGSPLSVGDRVFRPNLAHTLYLIARNGSAAVFYDPEGPIAPNLVRAVRRTGGILTLEDFVDYDVEVGPAITVLFRGREVATAPNPASGPILVNGLNVLGGFDKPAKAPSDFEGVATQRLVETMKWMGAGRSQLGDPVDIDNSALIKQILDPKWADAIRSNISDDTTHPWQFYRPAYEGKDPHGTAHFSIVDADGMAVSMTTTVNLLFGSLVVDPVTGIVLNNEMDDFSTPGTRNAFDLEPSIYNYIAPFKRPLSSCVPTVITDLTTQRPELVIGAAGGSKILTSVFQAIVRKLEYGLPLLDVVRAARIHHQLLPDVAFLELGAPETVQRELEQRGHTVKTIAPATSMNGIYIDPISGVIHAVSDYWRKRGQADGY
jgi:gamma-glutamyltranspeptidase